MGNEIQIRSIDDVQRVAVIAAESRLFGVRNVEEAAIKIMYGVEMGLPALQALMSVNMIQGKPTLSANLVAALVKSSKRYAYTVPVWDETQCVIEWFDHGKPVGKSSFSMQDAKQAGLLKAGSGWEKYRKAMLFARALTQGARAYCADVFVAPIYTPEELGGEDNEVHFEPQAAPAVPTVTQTPSVKTASAFKGIIEKASADPAERKRLVTLVYTQLKAEGHVPDGIDDPGKQYTAIDAAIKADLVSADYCQYLIDSEKGEDVAPNWGVVDTSVEEVEVAASGREPGSDG